MACLTLEENYSAEIDGLRAIAIVPVVLFHAKVPYFENGYVGVDIFFVISGYLIARQLAGSQHGDRLSLIEFFERRVRRIFPALLFVIACTATLSFEIVSPIRMVEIAKSIVAACTFLANFWFLSQDGYFATPTMQQPLIHVWSLAIEGQFYVCFPLILYFLVRLRFSHAHKVVALAFLTVVSVVFSQYLSRTEANNAFFRPDARAWEFLLGSLGAFCSPVIARFREMATFLGIIAILFGYFALPMPLAPNLLYLPPCIGALLVILGAGGKTSTNCVLGAPRLVFVGLISYSLYLWHQPLLALARLAKLGPLSGAEITAVLAASIILSVLTWRFVESPPRNRQLFSGKQILAGTVIGTTILLVFSALAITTTGFAFRYGDGIYRYLATVDPLDDSGPARIAAIRRGICHFRKGINPPIEDFLVHWRCTGGKTGRGILVVGDSHAGDVAAGFMLNRIEIAQMTGAGCILSPKRMSRDCRRLFDLALSHGDTFKMIVMANDQTSNLYTKEDIDDMLIYWGMIHIPIVWLSDMPHFPEINDLKLKNRLSYGDDMAGVYPILLEKAYENYNTMNGLSAGRFIVIDTSKVYCSISSGQGRCLPYLSGVGWLAGQTGHLTSVGARLFVQSLLAHYQIFDEH